MPNDIILVTIGQFTEGRERSVEEGRGKRDKGVGGRKLEERGKREKGRGKRKKGGKRWAARESMDEGGGRKEERGG